MVTSTTLEVGYLTFVTLGILRKTIKHRLHVVLTGSGLTSRTVV